MHGGSAVLLQWFKVAALCEMAAGCGCVVRSFLLLKKKSGWPCDEVRGGSHARMHCAWRSSFVARKGARVRDLRVRQLFVVVDCGVERVLGGRWECSLEQGA